MVLIQGGLEEIILKQDNSLFSIFEQKRSDSKWIKKREERHELFSKLLSKENILSLLESDFRKIIKNLWAFNGWNNKDYLVDQILAKNDLTKIRESLNDLLYGSDNLELRFDNFKIKNLGTASITEIMSFVNPDQYALWNDKPRKVFHILGIDQIPDKVFKYSQISGSNYVKCNQIMKDIRTILTNKGFIDIDLLDVDLFIHTIFDDKRERHTPKNGKITNNPPPETQDMTHWDAIGLITELGNTLGFDTYVADPTRKYKNKPLGNIASSKDVPEQCKTIPGITLIDVIWSRPNPPFYMFEVEDKGTMRDALLRLYQARVFDTKFLVVCPSTNRDKFKKYVTMDPYNAIKDRYLFRSFDELYEIYKSVMSNTKIKNQFFGD